MATNRIETWSNYDLVGTLEVVEGMKILKRQRHGNLWYYRWDPSSEDYSFLTVEDVIDELTRSDETNRMDGLGEYPFVMDLETGEISELEGAGKAWERRTPLFCAFKAWDSVVEAHAAVRKDCSFYESDRERFLKEKRNHARRERRRALAA